ncbi:MAG: hypothetical protein ACYDDB_01360 [bacterium]
MSDHWEIKKVYHSCKLNENDLKNLIEKAQADMPAPNNSISVKILHKISTQKDYPGLNSFFKEAEKCSIYELNKLDITIIEYDRNKVQVKEINISFSNCSISVTTEGDNEVWVLGKIEAIIRFLKTKKPLLWFLRTPFIIFLDIIVILSFPIALNKLLLIESIAISPLLIHIIDMVSYLIILFIFISLQHKYFSFTQIILKSKKPFFIKYSPIILQIASIVITIYFGIVLKSK